MKKVTQAELGRRIRIARESHGISQARLGTATNLNRTSVVQIESGKRSVSSLELDGIAYALGRSLSSFFAPAFEEQNELAVLLQRYPDTFGQMKLPESVKHSLRLGREITNLERLLGQDKMLGIPSYKVDSKWQAIQIGKKVAAEERRRLGLGQMPVEDPAKIIEAQGVRLGDADFPESVSGMTLFIKESGIHVFINAGHAPAQRRFSLAHEYAHVLIDRDEDVGFVSRNDDRNMFSEVRANAFAAAFLMPAEGVRKFYGSIGKDEASRSQISVFDETSVVQVSSPRKHGGRQIGFGDILLMTDHFKVSISTAAYRTKNLKLISEPQCEIFIRMGKSREGQALLDSMGITESGESPPQKQPNYRLLMLALEAVQQEEISSGKFLELSALAGIDFNLARSLRGFGSIIRLE